MAICSGCDRCYHLRCVMPPMSTVPSGDWFCPGCDPWFTNVSELCDPDTVLVYAPGDPHVDDFLLAYVRSGMDDSVIQGLARGRVRAIRHRATALRPHRTVPEWLMVLRHRKGANPVWLCCPPVSYRWDVIRCMHDALGHAGVQQTCAYLQQHFHWRGLPGDVRLFVAQCDACQRRRLALPAPFPMQEPVVRGPFEHVHIDLCGPFVTPCADIHGRLYLPDAQEKVFKAWVVVMIDYFTKAAEFAVIYDKTAASVARAFYFSWICRYFVPSHVTSDNGTEFEVQFGHLLARLGIKHVHTSACHPAANGVAERLVGSFKSMLERHVNSHPIHWVQSVPVMRQQYWARVHTTLGISPQEMVFGRQPVPVLPLARDVLAVAAAARVWVWPELFECEHPALHAAQLRQQLAVVDQDVFARIKQQFQRNARAWPLRGARRTVDSSVSFNKGDLVLEVVSGPVANLGDGVRGPFRVLEVRDNGVVLLTTGSTGFRDAAAFTRHISNPAKSHDNGYQYVVGLHNSRW